MPVSFHPACPPPGAAHAAAGGPCGRLAATAALVFGACLPAAAAAYTVYDGPVDPPPRGCNIAAFEVPDGVGRVRPVLQLDWGTPTYAEVNLGAPQPRGYRQVAFRYDFTRLHLKLPQVQGVFRVSQVRAVVYKGPSTSFPVASDQVRSDGTATIGWTGSAVEGPVPIGSSFQSQWLVQVVSSGYWRNDAWNPWLPGASVTMNCTMTVVRPSTPILR